MTNIWTTDGAPVALYDTAGNFLLGGDGGNTGGDPGGATPTDPSLLTTRHHFADKCGWWRGSGDSGASGTTVITEHTATTPAKDIQIRYGVHNQAGASEGVSGRAWLIHNDAPHPFTWGGAADVWIEQSESQESDPLDYQIEAGETFYVAWQHPPSTRFPTGYLEWHSPNSREFGGPFRGAVGEMRRALISGAPTTITGLTPDTRPPSIALLGDSFYEIGWGRYGLDAVGGTAWTDLTQWAEQAPTTRTGQRNRIGASGPLPFDWVYAGHNVGGTYAEAMSRTLAYWRWIVDDGAKLASRTMHPYTQSTDGWTTIEGQTMTADRLPEDRWARNDWLRDGAPMNALWEPYETGTTNSNALRAGDAGHPLAVPVFDEATHCEDPATKVWKVDGGPWVSDGTHMTRNGSDQLQPHWEQWLRDHIV